jgi:hypothetical protein
MGLVEGDRAHVPHSPPMGDEQGGLDERLELR